MAPGMLSFWYKTSCEPNRDFLYYTIDGGNRVNVASGETPWTKYAIELNPGPHTFRWGYDTDSSGTAGADAVWVDQVEVTPFGELAEGLDSSLVFTTGGDGAWVGQDSVFSHDGVDRVNSGLIQNGQESWMETTVTGPGQLKYWWRCSSQADSDFARLLIDGVEELRFVRQHRLAAGAPYGFPRGAYHSLELLEGRFGVIIQ